MRYSIPVLTFLALANVPAHAQSDQVRRGPAPSWAVTSELMPVPENFSGPLFVRRQDVLIHLDAKGQAEYLGYRFKLLHPNALQLGNLSIVWNPASGPPVVHAIKIYRDSQVIDVLAKSSFSIMRREDQLEAAKLDGNLTAVLNVADLRVGDELEVAITTRSNDPTLGSESSGLLMLLPTPSPGRFRLGLSWETAQKPTIKMTPDMASVAEQQGGTVDFRFDNPVMLNPPKDSPPRYLWQRVVEYTDFADWQTMSRTFAPLFDKAARLGSASPIKREASRIASAYAGPLDRAGAALKLVQQDVRYIYVGLDGGNLTPATAEETWQRRYGDCKGKTALLLALLAELGIDAEPVLVNNSGFDDGLDERLPSPRMFDHVLVRAQIDGMTYWLDGTLPSVASPSAAPLLPYRWVLPLTDGGVSIERIAWQPSSTPDEITLHEIDARDGFDQPARITMTTIVRGIKGLQEQVQLSGLAPGQLLSGLRQKLTGDTWQTIEDAQWTYDQNARASILTIKGTGTVDWDDDGDGAKSLALPGGSFSPPGKRIRSADQDQKAPYYNAPDYTCHATTVRVPTGTSALDWSFKPGYDTRIFGRNYYRAFELRDGAIRMVRGSRVENLEVAAEVAQKDNARISAFDNSKGWVFYDPDSKSSAHKTGKTVPTTYDFDWTGDNVPCVTIAAGS